MHFDLSVSTDFFIGPHNLRMCEKVRMYVCHFFCAVKFSRLSNLEICQFVFETFSRVFGLGVLKKFLEISDFIRRNRDTQYTCVHVLSRYDGRYHDRWAGACMCMRVHVKSNQHKYVLCVCTHVCMHVYACVWIV